MILIKDSDLGIPCDGCTCHRAAYALTMNLAVRYVRMYCPTCTAEFLQGAVKVLRDNESLHDYIETEHIAMGASING